MPFRSAALPLAHWHLTMHLQPKNGKGLSAKAAKDGATRLIEQCNLSAAVSGRSTWSLLFPSYPDFTFAALFSAASPVLPSVLSHSNTSIATALADRGYFDLQASSPSSWLTSLRSITLNSPTTTSCGCFCALVGSSIPRLTYTNTLLPYNLLIAMYPRRI